MVIKPYFHNILTKFVTDGECEIYSVTNEQIVCKTPAKPTSLEDYYPGMECLCIYNCKIFHFNGSFNTGRERLIRSHSSARFCFELSGNSN